MYLTNKENEFQTCETIGLKQFCNEAEPKFEPRTS